MKKLVLLISILANLPGISQIGGSRPYDFLNIPMTARAAALGGSSMSIWGNDLNLIYSNPALLNPSMSGQIAFNYSRYVSDLNFGYLAYAKTIKQYGTFAASVQFYDYGKFVGYDEFGQKTTNFNANDYSINLNYAKPLADSLFNIGVSLKTIISQYDTYHSIGNALDFGVTYHKKRLVLSLLAKNIGYMWKNYSSTGTNSQALPRDVQFGLSYKISKAPFKLFFVYDNLLTWNLKFVNPVDTAGQSNPFSSSTSQTDSSGFQKFKNRAGNRIDNFLRHFTFGTEILLTQNFNLRIAYNYRRQREMILPDKRGVNGLSLGFGFKVKRFGFSYSFTKMAAPGSSNMFGITASI